MGGGSGGAIYNDGNDFTLTLCGVSMLNNHGREYGGAIFFVSNDRSGHLLIDHSELSHNVSEGRRIVEAAPEMTVVGEVGLGILAPRLGGGEVAGGSGGPQHGEPQ